MSLKSVFTNTWMNNVNYLAAMAHIGWAALIIVLAALFSNVSLVWCGWISLAFVACAFVKEYWYDANYELPKQTFADNTTDFLAYVAGVALGWGAIGIKLYALSHT